MYKMYLGVNSGEEGFMIPVLPEKIELSENGDNKTYNIINLGEVNVINLPKLTDISIESYFPKNSGPYVSSSQLFEPSFYVSKIREWRSKNKKIRFIFTGGPIEINDLFSIEDFKCSENGGEVGDIYYSIDLKRYKHYSAKKVVIVKPKATKATSASNKNSSKASTVVLKKTTAARPVNKVQVKTYTVISGDSLWAISKRYLGNGNRYGEIAALNNIPNPSLIYPGQVLKIP